MLVLLFHLVHPSFRQREFVRWSLLCLLDKSMQHDQRLFAKQSISLAILWLGKEERGARLQRRGMTTALFAPIGS
jgi:hypothetical protein